MISYRYHPGKDSVRVGSGRGGAGHGKESGSGLARAGLGLGIRGGRTHVDGFPDPNRSGLMQVKRASQLVILLAIVVVGACASAGASAGDGSRAGADLAEHQADEAAHAGRHADDADPAAHHGGDAAGVHPGDVRFMQQMIGHHAQALTMAAMAATHGAGEHLLRLAEKIDISQRDEIGMMERWLRDRKQEVPPRADAHAMHRPGMSMPGMLTPEELARLDGARGREFERLFLTFMIRHHEGALQMVDELFASPGAAQDSDIFRFVTDVAADQLDEIDQMQYLLDTMRSNQESEIR